MGSSQAHTLELEPDQTIDSSNNTNIETMFEFDDIQPDSQRHVIAIAMMFSVVCLLLSFWCFICHRQKRAANAEGRTPSITAVGPMVVDTRHLDTNANISPLLSRGDSRYSMPPVNFNPISPSYPQSVGKTVYPKSISFYDEPPGDSYVPYAYHCLSRDMATRRYECGCRRSLSHSSSVLIRDSTQTTGATHHGGGPAAGHLTSDGSTGRRPEPQQHHGQQHLQMLPSSSWLNTDFGSSETNSRHVDPHQNAFDDVSIAAGSYVSDCRFSLRRNESPILSLRKCFAETMSHGHLSTLTSHQMNI